MLARYVLAAVFGAMMVGGGFAAAAVATRSGPASGYQYSTSTLTTTTATTTTVTTPTTTTTATTPVKKKKIAKVLVCHRTRSKKRPYRLIRVARSQLRGHLRHGDVRPTNGRCPRHVVKKRRS